MRQPDIDLFEEKLRAAGAGGTAIRAFRRSLDSLAEGGGSALPESTIAPVSELPDFDSMPMPDESRAADLIQRSVVIKLNGGLGTGMGLEKAKSLLEVKDGLTFLDLIARQVLHLRGKAGAAPRFLLMNSFSTSADTLGFLERYPELGDPREHELMQNRIPKVDAATLAPVRWERDPSLEWCPPGHGDIYVALAGSGWLDRLLDDGVRYAFVSNSDNLGATLSARILNYVAAEGLSFLMEVTRRSGSDRKGGHLAARRDTGHLVLRESAQCPESDMDAFQDIERHRFFNTNNLWVDLEALRDLLGTCDGVIPLPVIRNRKTVDPRDRDSPEVIQLETAMGAAIGAFDRAGAVAVPRSRFAPVKTTADLLALRSDVYIVTEDWRVTLAPGRGDAPPHIDLDSTAYKLIDGLEKLIPDGAPSLAECNRLAVSGPARFEAGTRIVGDVAFRNSTAERAVIPARIYRDEEVELG